MSASKNGTVNQWLFTNHIIKFVDQVSLQSPVRGQEERFDGRLSFLLPFTIGVGIFKS